MLNACKYRMLSASHLRRSIQACFFKVKDGIFVRYFL
jgi:hypothetical protein